MAKQRLADFSQRRDAIAFHKLALEADRDERLRANEKKEPQQGVAAAESVRGLESQVRADDYQIAQIESQVTLQYEQLPRLLLQSMDVDSNAQELKRYRDWIDKLVAQVQELSASLDAPPRVYVLQPAGVIDADM